MSKLKTISKKWVEEKNNFLKNNLPKNVQRRIFYPDNNFYTFYYSDNLKGLRYMAAQIFAWLNIEANGCIVDFYNGQDVKGMGDAAGFYTKIKDENSEEKEVIFINSKHKSDSMAVGAILAHEMMHLYLFRLGLKLEDTQENELLTDLATINTGLSILILNGMSYSSQWWLTIIMLLLGRLYWRSEQLAFGYFKPRQYGRHALEYFKENNLKLGDIFSHMKPSSRFFVPHFLIARSDNPTPLIKSLEKQHRKSNFIKGGVVIAVIAVIMYFGNQNNNSETSQTNLTPEQTTLGSQIDDCKSELNSMESTVNSDQDNLNSMDNEMNTYNQEGETENYNSLVSPYNSLLTKIKSETSEYNQKLTECNNLIDSYNTSLK